MNTRIILYKSISTILLLSLLLVLTIGCTTSGIVGKWQDTESSDTLEFTAEGDVIVISGGNIITGKYELIGSDVVKVKLEGLSGAFLSLFSADKWQYEISGKTMTMKIANRTSVLKRI